MRWRQDKDTGELIPIDDAARAHSRHAIHGDIDAFVSPIDGTVIADRKQYREHCKKHNVVPSKEFTPEYYQKKAEERAKVYKGIHSKEEQFRRKQELYNNWIAEERKHGW